MGAVKLEELVPIKSGVDVDNLNPDFYVALMRMLQDMPVSHRETLTIGSGKRSSWAQWRGWIRHRFFWGPVAARPGTSMHEKGLAVDFHPHTGHSDDRQNYPFRVALNWCYKHGPKFDIHGLTDRYGNHWKKDLVHFEYRPNG